MVICGAKLGKMTQIHNYWLVFVGIGNDFIAIYLHLLFIKTMKSCLFIVVFGLYSSPALGQQDSLKNKKIYSVSLVAQAGYSNKLGNLPNTFFSNIVNGTNLDNYHLKLYQEPNFFNLAEIGLNVGWKIKKFRNRIFSFCEYSSGVSFCSNRGNQGYYYSETNADSGYTTPFYMEGVRWSNKIAIHSKPFFKDFAFCTGVNTILSYMKSGSINGEFVNYKIFNTGYSEIKVYSSKNTCASISFPLVLKYNASCDLNLEFFYSPEFLCFTSDIFKPSNYAHFNVFGAQLRLKLDTSPTNSNNKRTDAFF